MSNLFESRLPEQPVLLYSVLPSVFRQPVAPQQPVVPEHLVLPKSLLQQSPIPEQSPFPNRAATRIRVARHAHTRVTGHITAINRTTMSYTKTAGLITSHSWPEPPAKSRNTSAPSLTIHFLWRICFVDIRLWARCSRPAVLVVMDATCLWSNSYGGSQSSPYGAWGKVSAAGGSVLCVPYQRVGAFWRRLEISNNA